MIRQTVRPFKLEKTNDLSTSRAGPALSGEFALGLELLKKPDRHPPKPDSGARAVRLQLVIARSLRLIMTPDKGVVKICRSCYS